MRVHARENETAVGICDASRHQGVCGQLLIAAVSDHPGIVQAEYKAFRGSGFDDLADDAVVIFSLHQDFFLFSQSDADRQIGIGGRYPDFHNSGLLVNGGKGYVIRRRVKYIAFRGGCFNQVIPSQRKNA